MKPRETRFLDKVLLLLGVFQIYIFFVVQISSLGTFPFSSDFVSTFLMACHYVKCGGVLVCTVGNAHLSLTSPLSFVYRVPFIISTSSAHSDDHKVMSAH